jgi:threonine dehydratase
MQEINNIEIAINRISGFINETPIINSQNLDLELKNSFYFKAESEQVSRAFKIRGVFNHLLELKEREGLLPQKVVAYTTGNHGIGLSIAAKKLNIHARIYAPKNILKTKQDLMLENGAELIITETRLESEELTKKDSIENGFYYLHPSKSDTTIAGVGTMCYEALIQMKKNGVIPDFIFASCGGGGLLSGSLLAKNLFMQKILDEKSSNNLFNEPFNESCNIKNEELNKKISLFGAEPLNANDAYLSFKQGHIHKFDNSPDTIADGLRTLALSEETFKYIKMLDDIFLVNEKDIIYWTEKINSLFPFVFEYSACISMAAAFNFCRDRNYQNKKILVLLSGGNL